MDQTRARRISFPVLSTTPTELIQPYRSIRSDRRGRVTKEPQIYSIPEVESEVVEKRWEKPKISSRPSSSGSSSKEKINVYERVHYSKSDKDMQHQAQVHVNHGFIESNSHINRSTSTLYSSPIVREQYCSCCKRWTRREKFLLIIVACLLGVIFGLFVSLGILIEKQNGNNTDSMWFSFRL